MCRPLGTGCPLSALGAIGVLDFYPAGLQLSTRVPPTSPCLDPGGFVQGSGGNHVEVVDRPGGGDCGHAYEVQIYSNDVGQIVAVNLLTPTGRGPFPGG